MKSGLALVFLAASLLCSGVAAAQAPGAVPATPTPASPPPGPSSYPTAAQAGPPGYPPALPPAAVTGSSGRRGLTFGIGIGGGSIQCDNDQCGELETFSLNAHVGAMVNPRLAVAIDLWGNYHFDYGTDELRSDETLSALSFASIVVRGWLTERFWIQGGLGAATYGQQTESPGGRSVDYSTDAVAAVVLGAGYEVISNSRYSLDLALRMGTGDFTEELDIDGNLTSGAFVVGFNWY